MANELLNPFQQFKDNGGTILERGTIEFFNEGQVVVQKSIFSDSDLTVSQSNPYTLDDYGRIRGDVHYDGQATIVISNAAGLEIRRVDGVVSSSDGETEKITVYRDSVASMVADDALEVGQIVRTKSYFADAEVGGARYLISAAGTGTPDNYTVHAMGNGLQAVLLDREKRCSPLYAGARGDDGSDDTVPMQALINVCEQIEVPEGYSFICSNLTIPGSRRFVGRGRIKQLNNSSGDLFQITSKIAYCKFKGVRISANQQNGNQANSSVGWVLSG